MQYIPQTHAWQMKHGIATEFHSKVMYKKVMTQEHTNCTVSDYGMYIFDTYPFISASPDLLIECKLLIDKAPNIEYYGSHMEEIDGVKYIRKQSPYFFQMQGQKAVTGRTYCDFFDNNFLVN